MARTILIMGLPGSGKTTLAMTLLRSTNAVCVDAGAVRREVGVSIEGRVEHARRMGRLCDRVVEADGSASMGKR